MKNQLVLITADEPAAPPAERRSGHGHVPPPAPRSRPRTEVSRSGAEAAREALREATRRVAAREQARRQAREAALIAAAREPHLPLPGPDRPAPHGGRTAA